MNGCWQVNDPKNLGTGVLQVLQEEWVGIELSSRSELRLPVAIGAIQPRVILRL